MRKSARPSPPEARRHAFAVAEPISRSKMPCAMPQSSWQREKSNGTPSRGYGQKEGVCGARLSRRSFVKTGGALVVGFGIFRGRSAQAAAMIKGDAFDVSLPASWIEIRPDNTVLFRTGKSDFGQGTIYTAYRQIVADELDM